MIERNRETIVNRMLTFLGTKQGDARHLQLLDVYNNYIMSGKAKGSSTHLMTKSDAWCMATVSAIAILCGYTDIIPVECSCTREIELLKKIDSWEEKDDYVPSPGDLCFYYWNDSKNNYRFTDCIQKPNHVGIVTQSANGWFDVCEGNQGDAHVCAMRHMEVNGRCIRGFGVPKYTDSAKVVEEPKPNKENVEYITKYTVKKGDTLSQIASMYNTSVDDIVRLNSCIQNPNKIKEGWELIISSPMRYYTVKKGETLSKIGKDMKIPWQDIAKLNGIKAPYIIRTGQIIRIK